MSDREKYIVTILFAVFCLLFCAVGYIVGTKKAEEKYEERINVLTAPDYSWEDHCEKNGLLPTDRYYENGIHLRGMSWKQLIEEKGRMEEKIRSGLPYHNVLDNIIVEIERREEGVFSNQR